MSIDLNLETKESLTEITRERINLHTEICEKIIKNLLQRDIAEVYIFGESQKIKKILQLILDSNEERYEVRLRRSLLHWHYLKIEDVEAAYSESMDDLLNKKVNNLLLQVNSIMAKYHGKILPVDIFNEIEELRKFFITFKDYVISGFIYPCGQGSASMNYNYMGYHDDEGGYRYEFKTYPHFNRI